MQPTSPGRDGRVTPVAATAADGVALSGLLVESGERAGQQPGAGDVAIVVGHGLSNHVRRPHVQRVLHRLARTAPVFALDFRGHGRSGGTCTVGKDEVLDLAAAVGLARRHGYRTVATLGFSMGATVVIRHAALTEQPPPAAVAAVSGPARWWVRETRAMRRVHWMLEQPHGRLAGRAIGVRVGGQWGEDVPASPVEVVGRITPTPLLIVHGDADHYFPPEQAHALHRAAGGDAELWLERGMRHAETSMTPELLDRIAEWLVRSAGRGARRGEAA